MTRPFLLDFKNARPNQPCRTAFYQIHVKNTKCHFIFALPHPLRKRYFSNKRIFFSILPKKDDRSDSFDYFWPVDDAVTPE